MRYLIGLACAASLLAGAQAHGEELRPQLDDMVRHFGHVLFGSEYGIAEGQKVVAKWHGEVGITIQGRATADMGKMASRHLTGLMELTGLRFKQRPPGSPGQSIDLMFMKRKEMPQLVRQLQGRDAQAMKTMISDPTMVCFFLSWKKPEQRIVKSIVVINVERDPVQLNACLLEELTQVMGLPNDVDAYWPTLFQPNDVSTSWSRWDRLYLKTLYDPRLKAGMKPVDALYQAKKIFAEELAKSP